MRSWKIDDPPPCIQSHSTRHGDYYGALSAGRDYGLFTVWTSDPHSWRGYSISVCRKRYPDEYWAVFNAVSLRVRVSIACRRTVNLLFFHCETQSNLWIRTAQTFLIVATSCALAAVASGITEVFEGCFHGVLFGIPLVMIIPAWILESVPRVCVHGKRQGSCFWA